MQSLSTRVLWSLFTLVVLSLSGCSKNEDPAPINNANLVPTSPINGSGVVFGSVMSSTICGGGNIQLNLMSGTTAVYQTSTVINGSFEMHANPGNYILYAQGGGCYTQQNVILTANQRVQINVSLNQTSGQYPTNSPYPTNPTYPTTPTYPGNYYTQPYYPACPYGTYGCYGNYYPGGGNMFAGKPNIYVSGREDFRFKMAIKYRAENNLLAAIPIHGPRGWLAAIHEKGVQVGQGIYPYLFYDFRANADRLQTAEGFCTSATDLIPKLTSHLESLGFKSNEIEDFEQYWKPRLPKAQRFCVYVQDNQSIEKVAELEIEPKPEAIVRVWYVIIPEVKEKTTDVRFSRWLKKPKTIAQTKAKSRKIASLNEDAFIVREWGVSFLLEPNGK